MAKNACESDGDLDFDVLIIGAGMSGMYQLYRLRELGLSTRVLEAGTGVGGTWYWNRYPGARFDSESWSYGYSFSQELLDEWDWTEHFAGQLEVERSVNLISSRVGLFWHSLSHAGCLEVGSFADGDWAWVFRSGGRAEPCSGSSFGTDLDVKLGMAAPGRLGWRGSDHGGGLACGQ